MAGPQLPCSFLWWACWAAALSRVEAVEIIAADMETAVLAPSQPYQMKVGVDRAKFMPFNCMGGPADVVISLSTYSEKASPLLFVSLNPKKAPSFQSHDASTFTQWREDKAGDHYVIAKAVGPKGGILGLVNMQHFAEEELDAVLSIHCTFIIAFDTLFWDHLRSSAVCPVGNHLENGQVIQASNFCSGHGKCGKQGVCLCDGHFTGPACEHGKSDVVVSADGHYAFKVATGRYQYFRVRIPPSFAGGYLEVEVMAQQPLVVLVRGDDLPTKSNYELSNFDDWISGRYISVLKFRVPPLQGDATSVPYGHIVASDPFGGIGMGGKRQLHGNASQVTATGRRKLQQTSSNGSTWTADCTGLEPLPSTLACTNSLFSACHSDCQRCMGCVKGRPAKGRGNGDGGCTRACDRCQHSKCVGLLAACAQAETCESRSAVQCDEKCSACMTCLDSNDEKCMQRPGQHDVPGQHGAGGCDCCTRCIPIAFKCIPSLSLLHDGPAERKRFVYVGVYNHRRLYNEQDVVHAAADISLKDDPYFQREQLPSSWVADLYDPFHDIRSLEVTQSKVYPSGDQFIYNLQIRQDSKHETLQVRVYRDRMTLLHVWSPADTRNVVLSFTPASEVRHMLSSSMGAPKTVFDFDLSHAKQASLDEVVSFSVPTFGKTTMWCAVFGASDGLVTLDARAIAVAPQIPGIGLLLVLLFGVLTMLFVLGFVFGGMQRLGDFLGMDPSIPLMERLGCLVGQNNPHESTASLTRTGSLSGFVGSDVIDRSLEDQYLHRGGAGDDGI